MSLVEDLNLSIELKSSQLGSLEVQREELAAAETAFTQLYGGDSAQDLLKRFGPKLAKYGAMFGLPTGLLAGAADPGAFSGVFNAIGKVLGLFGLG